MADLERGVLKFYVKGNFFQRIEKADDPRELDSIYDELNDAWEKENVPISKDILDLFVYNKHISKELFEKVSIRLSFDMLDIIKVIYINLEQYDYIELKDLLLIRVLEYPENYANFINYILNQNYKTSEIPLIVINNAGATFSKSQITLFWEARNQILDNEEKKKFIKKLLKQKNVSKEIFFQSLEEFKNDIDIVVEVFINGIEYPEIFNKVLEMFPQEEIYKKIRSNMNSFGEEIALGYSSHSHILMSVARIADDNTLRRILNAQNEGSYIVDKEEIFNSQDEQEILEVPRQMDSNWVDDIWTKIMLCMTKNSNVSLETLKYIVQSTNDIEVLYYCIINSGRNLEIYQLIQKKKFPPLQEDLNNNKVLDLFYKVMEEIKEDSYIINHLELAQQCCSSFEDVMYDIHNIIGLQSKRYRNCTLFDVRNLVYDIIAESSNKKRHGNDAGILMDAIREQLKTLSFEGISSGAYHPDNFLDLGLREKAYFECLVNYGLVKEEPVKEFLKTCLGEEYLRRYERDLAIFSERGLDLSLTASKDTPQRR